MTRWALRLLAVTLAGHLGATALPVAAQFSALHRLEVQHGNTPFTRPAGLTTGFQQLNLRYDAGDLRLAVRAEQFLTHVDNRRYATLSQVRATYSRSGFRAEVGNFYEIIGRGLLLRGFEIPGATYEDAAFRVRQSFQRDIEGVSLGYSNGRFQIQALRGKPLVSVLPPTIDHDGRHPDLITAGFGKVHLGNLEVGGGMLRNESDPSNNDYASIWTRWTGPWGLGGYVESAQELGSEADETPRATYVALTWGRAGLGGSIEFKDYQSFFLGAGFNDPPSLVREHSWIVLNRSTHVLNAVNERGFQAEVYGHVPGAGNIVLNATRAVNDFGTELVYREYFVEYATAPGPAVAARVFLDLAEDPLKGQTDRISGGVYLDRTLPGRWSASLSMEAQRFEREFFDPPASFNAVAALTISRSSRYSLGVVVERSTDPFLTDDPRSAEIETAARHWAGVNLGWRPNRRHTFSVFGGTRRGGPACTSGICYEVLDFEGIEIRATSRF